MDHHDDKFAFEACQAVSAWRRLEEAWPGGMPSPATLLNVDGVAARDRAHLRDLFERFVQVNMRTAMTAQDRLRKEEK